MAFHPLSEALVICRARISSPHGKERFPTEFKSRCRDGK